MAVEDDADRPTSLIYHSVTNAAIVATVQVVLWSAFLASLTWYFDTSPGQYISPVVIGIVAGAAGAYMNPNPPTMGPWIQVIVVYLLSSGLAMLVGRDAAAGWQEVVAVALVAALALTVVFFTSAHALRPWVVRNARRVT